MPRIELSHYIHRVYLRRVLLTLIPDKSSGCSLERVSGNVTWVKTPPILSVYTHFYVAFTLSSIEIFRIPYPWNRIHSHQGLGLGPD